MNTPLGQYFTEVYEKKVWGDNHASDYNGSSGGGSTLDYNMNDYIPNLRKFISEKNIQSVADLGCGDWLCGSAIYDYFDIKYTGYDAYKKIVDHNTVTYPKYTFKHLDFFSNPQMIESADLCILKDVLQHWTMDEVYKFLDEVVDSKKFKYILICNCANQTKNDPENPSRSTPLSANFFPLKKYLPSVLFKYHTKEVSLIEPLDLDMPFFTNIDPKFENIELTYEQQTYVRGKPRNYLKYASMLFNKYTNAKTILEVGSIRMRMEHSIQEFNPACCNDGHSTYFWKYFTNANIHTVDINSTCKALINSDPRLTGVNSITSDANEFIRNFKDSIDLLFLDAWDVVPGTPYAEEHLNAYLNAKPLLADRCIILIDDTDVGNGGKGKIVIPQLIRDGFKCILSGRQTLFIR